MLNFFGHVQFINIVESKELRELLLYLNADLSDDDIPHRQKLTEIIFESYKREWSKLVNELQVGLILLISFFGSQSLP